MADLDKDGKLDFAEFVIMTHILFTCRNGIPLPQELPPSLIPPSKSHLIDKKNEIEEVKEVEVESDESESDEEEEEKHDDTKIDSFDFGLGSSSVPSLPPKPIQQQQPIQQPIQQHPIQQQQQPIQQQPIQQPIQQQPIQSMFDLDIMRQSSQPTQSQQSPKLSEQFAQPEQQPSTQQKPEPEPEDTNPDETKDKKYLWMKWRQNKLDLKRREEQFASKEQDLKKRQDAMSDLYKQIHEAKDLLERKKLEVQSKCLCSVSLNI